MLGSLIHLAKYLLWHQTEHDGFYGGIKEFVTSDSISRIQYQVPTMSTSSPSLMISDGPNVSATDFIKIQVTDYPSFGGKKPDWLAFYKKFTSTAELQRFSTYLQEDPPDHESKMGSDPAYVARCYQLYSILKHICAG